MDVNIDADLAALNARIAAMEAQASGGPAYGADPSYDYYDDESDEDDEDDYAGYGAAAAAAAVEPPAITYRDDVEDRLAWDQQEQVSADSRIAEQLQLRATGMMPGKAQELTEVTPGGLLVRTFSSEKYDKMLAAPNLSHKTRLQILRMRDKRVAKEGMDVTTQTKLLNKFEVEQNDSRIAATLAQGEGTGGLAGVTDQIAMLQDELGITAEAAEAAMAGINQMWQTEDQLAREEDGDRFEQFEVDQALASAEQSRVDGAVASKMEPPSGGKGGKGMDGGLSPHSAAVAMAMPIEGAGSYGPAFLDSLIAQTASAAGIEEGGLRDYIEFARRQSLITQLAQNAGVPEEALAEFVQSYGTR